MGKNQHQLKMGKTAVIAVLLCLEFVFSVPSSSAPVTIVQDWLTLNTFVQRGGSSSGYIGEYGVLQHVWSKKNILPAGGSCPRDETLIRLGDTSSSDANLFRFVQVRGHQGYIENKCGSNIHPWFRDYPKDATRLVVDKDRNSMAYFSFDEVNEQIVHFGGMLIHPKGGSVDPPTGVEMVLHSDNHDGAKFTMVPSPYPQPELTGHWERLFAVINPVGEHTYTINFKIGKSMTKEATEKVHWKVSANLALNWFKANGEYEKYATLAKSETWEVEVDSSYSLKVLPGPTVVTWQWVFDAERLDESYRFRSTILGDTNDLNTTPEI